MQEFFVIHQRELIATIITIVALFLFRLLLLKTAERVGRRSEIQITRTRLMFKYINILVTIIAAFLLLPSWGIKMSDLSLLFSSVFAVIGVALFAIWSILSNVTAGVILFFSFPYKIGNKIKIHDKDLPVEAVIEDIKAFHLHLRTSEGELITYPNNLILQKAVSLIEKDLEDEGKDAL